MTLPTDTVSILGFGRSGTTWVSDIVSKASGRAVLFEPLHPEVLDRSRELSYRSEFDEADSRHLRQHLKSVLDKGDRSAWLLRNHLPWPPHEIDAHLTDLIWDEVHVLGFKSIRATLAPDWVVQEFGRRMLFVMRHPLAVVASVSRRANFWEFGWPETYEIFIANSLAAEHQITRRVRDLFESRPAPVSSLERVATMWAITHAVAVPKLDDLGVPIFFYEDLYERPFTTSRKMLSHLGLNSQNLLPTYLFTPAMTTMRTLHGKGALKNQDGSSVPQDFFWQETLEPEEQKQVLEIVEAYGIGLYDPDGSRTRATTN